MARPGNVAARIMGLMLLAVLLAAVTQPGGIRSWIRAKFANEPAVPARAAGGGGSGG